MEAPLALPPKEALPPLPAPIQLAFPSELITAAPPLMEVNMAPAVPPVMALQHLFPSIEQAIPPVLAPVQVPAVVPFPGEHSVFVLEHV